MAPLISVEGLKHWYMRGTPFEEQVLYGVDMQVLEGEAVALVGPTRSGKSTLIQYFNGLFVPKDPGEGRVVVDGTDTMLKGQALHTLRQKVGLVFQYPEQQLFEETVEKDVGFGPRSLGLDREEVDRRVREALKGVGLDPGEFLDRYIFALSGGQKRRVAIAGVLALRPRVMVFDDPTAGLDVRGREEILETIKRLHDYEGVTVVFVSNTLEDVARIAKRVIVLFRGRVVADGPAREILTDVRLLSGAELDPPQVVEAVARLAEEGWGVRRDVLDVREAAETIYRAWLDGRLPSAETRHGAE